MGNLSPESMVDDRDIRIMTPLWAEKRLLKQICIYRILSHLKKIPRQRRTDFGQHIVLSCQRPTLLPGEETHQEHADRTTARGTDQDVDLSVLLLGRSSLWVGCSWSSGFFVYSPSHLRSAKKYGHHPELHLPPVRHLRQTTTTAQQSHLLPARARGSSSPPLLPSPSTRRTRRAPAESKRTQIEPANSKAARQARPVGAFQL
jgi:hypothetical protein